MYSDRLSSLVNHICHVWEDEMAENDVKVRAALNSMSAEHDLELFNMQKAFKSAIAAKNNEINDLITECKRLKYLLSQYGAEHKEMQRKLDDAYRTIDALKGNNDDGSEHSVQSTSKSVKSVDESAYFKDSGTYGSHLQRQHQSSNQHFDRGVPGYREVDAMQAYRHQGSSGSVGSLSDLGGAVFSPPTPTLPLSSAYGGMFPPTISLPSAGQSVQSKPVPANTSGTDVGSNGLVFGGRFVVDGDKDGNAFVGNPSRSASTDLSPPNLSSLDPTMLDAPPGFGGISSPSPSSSASTRTKSRLALADDSDSEAGAPPPVVDKPDVVVNGGTDDRAQDGETGAILNSIRLQSKSSKLDARPINSPASPGKTSPAAPSK